MANWAAYRAMKIEAAHLGLPQNFRDDLYKHDRRTLSRKTAPDTFGWILRESGTELLYIGNKWSITTAKYYQNYPEAHYFWYDGSALQYVEPDEMISRLEREVEDGTDSNLV